MDSIVVLQTIPGRWQIGANKVLGAGFRREQNGKMDTTAVELTHTTTLELGVSGIPDRTQFVRRRGERFALLQVPGVLCCLPFPLFV